MRRYLAIFVVLMAILPALAQDKADAEQEKSALLIYVEEQLSSPNRKISISGINGVLSSNAEIDRITIADREGVWLEINNAEIVWTRSALLTGSLVVDKLAAKSVTVSRQPLPDEGGVPSPEASGFAIPELPVSVNLNELAIDEVTFGQEVFGLASKLALKGSIELDTGKLETALEIDRLDGPGGKLVVKASYGDATGLLDLDMSLFEPQDGVVANLLNFHGKPAVNLGLKGSGEIDDLVLSLALDADEQRILSGKAAFSGTQAGRRFTIDAAGPVGSLVKPDLRDLFGEHSELAVSGIVQEAGGLDIERLSLLSGALQLQAKIKTAPDGFPLAISLDGAIQSADGSPVVLPVPGGDTKVAGATLSFAFGGSSISTWSGKVNASRFVSSGVSAQDFTLDLSGAAIALDEPAAREVTFVVDGQAAGLGSEDAAIAEAIGNRIGLKIAGAWKAGQPIAVDRAMLTAKVLEASFAGQIAGAVLDGRFGLTVANASVLSAALKRDLSGSASVAATGTFAPVSGAFDLDLDGQLSDLTTGSLADGLLVGTTRISGRAARGETGFRAEKFAISNRRLSFNANGLFGSETADFTFDVDIINIVLLSDKASGRMVANGRASGTGGLIDLGLNVRVGEGTLLERTLTGTSFDFEGQMQKSGLTGVLEGLAFIAGERVDFSASVTSSGEANRIDDLVFNAGATKLSGMIAAGDDGLFDGQMSLRSHDISTAAALFLVQAKGKVEADIELKEGAGGQNARLTAKLDGVQAETAAIGSGEADIALTDLFGVPGAEGRVIFNDAVVGGMEISVLSATASRRGAATDFEAGARMKNGTSVAAAGELSAEGEGYRLTLHNMDVVRQRVLARLLAPASVAVQADSIAINDARFGIDGGELAASGRIAETLDLSAELVSVPLDVANAIRPDLGLRGKISGTAKVTGPGSAPRITFKIAGDGLSATALRDAGLPALAVKADGNTEGDRLKLDAAVSSANGIGATARGTVPLGGGAMAVDVTLQSFPLALLNTVAKGQGLGGRLSGTAKVTGALARPSAKFALRANAVRASALAEAGLTPLTIGVNGVFAGQSVTLSSLKISGPGGFSVDGSGRIPLEGPGLNLSVDGAAPLSLANRQLVSRGARAAGTARFSVRLAGVLRRPSISGRISMEGASFTDPLANLALKDISVAAEFAGDRLVIRQGSAAIGAGGSVSLGGAVSLDAAAGFPADLKVGLNSARYSDGSLVVATVTGKLDVKGALLFDPLIAGGLTVNRAEVTIPETVAGGADGIDVKHVNPPKKVTRTLKLARADDGTPVPSGRPSVARLDVSINAPNRIFVRGRGLDSELGGSVRLTGPVTAIRPIGGFELIRGRLSILGKRIEFEEGEVTLVGDLDPAVRFVAKSASAGTTVFITVTGRASDPSIVFSSQPQLPQDEVLSRLIFGRGITELSPLQIAKLGASVAALAGGSNKSLLDSFRQSTGLDDLDVVTDSGGNAAVRAGRYVQDNVYLGVEAGASGNARGTVNIDITDNLKATGSAGSDGDSSIGLFFEKDY